MGLYLLGFVGHDLNFQKAQQLNSISIPALNKHDLTHIQKCTGDRIYCIHLGFKILNCRHGVYLPR